MKKVLVYSTDRCPFCVIAKDFLKNKKVPYEDINVGIDHKKAQEMIEKSGQMGVPVIDIDGEIIIGFNVPKIEKALKEKGFLKK